ncbi:MAG: oxidoreductase, partial [Corynebacterium sp.]|nr:oxidoreductase [Corynebacterium sp.]
MMVQGYPLACSPAGGTGYQTLINAGFSVEGTQKFPEFICRINGFPDAGVDKCLTASPASAYWTYWHAPLGATSWTYSNWGAHARSPQPGTVEAWTWGPGLEPGPVPVSRSTTTTETTTRSGSLRDSPMPTVPAFTWTPETPRNDQDTTTAAQSGEPTPEQNPDNPDEMLVFLDAEGNQISKQEYDQLVASAAQAAQAPGSPGGAVSAATGTGESAETTTEEPD